MLLCLIVVPFFVAYDAGDFLAIGQCCPFHSSQPHAPVSLFLSFRFLLNRRSPPGLVQGIIGSSVFSFLLFTSSISRWKGIMFACMYHLSCDRESPDTGIALSCLVLSCTSHHMLGRWMAPGLQLSGSVPRSRRKHAPQESQCSTTTTIGPPPTNAPREPCEQKK